MLATAGHHALLRAVTITLYRVHPTPERWRWGLPAPGTELSLQPDAVLPRELLHAGQFSRVHSRDRQRGVVCHNIAIIRTTLAARRCCGCNTSNSYCWRRTRVYQ